ADSHWLGGGVPKRTSPEIAGPEVAQCLATADETAKALYIEWLRRTGTNTGIAAALAMEAQEKFVPGEVVESCSTYSNVNNNNADKGSSKGKQRQEVCDAFGAEAVRLAFICSRCETAVWSCELHYESLREIGIGKGTCNSCAA